MVLPIKNILDVRLLQLRSYLHITIEMGFQILFLEIHPHIGLNQQCRKI